MGITKRFKDNPTAYYALSVCATWAGIGSLMNGVTMTQTYGIIPSAIWAFGNTLACMLFVWIVGRVSYCRQVFCSRTMKLICGIMCIFQSWLSMNGMQTIFADTVLGEKSGMIIAYALATLFLILLIRHGMVRNVLTDGYGWIAVYALAVIVTAIAMINSYGHYNEISLGLNYESMRTGIWKSILLLPGPFTYPYFFELLSYNENNSDGTSEVNMKKAFVLGGLMFGAYMLIVFPLAWAQFSPALNIIKAILITIIGTSTLSSAMYSIYIAFGKKIGFAVNALIILGWSILIPLGVMGLWTLMANIRIYLVGLGIVTAIVLGVINKHER
ncbi:MAG: hypothetical protein MJY95_08355 [Bacteroidaceae bacterium]|nr:hypothetical protein [Bacteroidaceae bacterium]